MNCELISKKFRPEHRDIEVRYKDSFGVEKFLYIALPDNVEQRIKQHFAEEDTRCEAICKSAEAGGVAP